ncbi:MAG: hypothetical protein ABJO67_03670 [Pseudoruegeria sp.]
MIKGLIKTAALFAATPAMAHVSGPHLHPHGFETTAVAMGGIVVVALILWLVSRRFSA